MPKEILRDPVITVNSVDLSDNFRQATIDGEWNAVDFTTFGSGWEETGKGLRKATITLGGFQNYDAGEAHQTLWPLFNADVTFPVTVKPHAGAVSTTNPLWSMTARLMKYQPLDGEIGDASKIAIEFTNAAQTGLTQATT